MVSMQSRQYMNMFKRARKHLVWEGPIENEVDPVWVTHNDSVAETEAQDIVDSSANTVEADLIEYVRQKVVEALQAIGVESSEMLAQQFNTIDEATASRSVRFVRRHLTGKDAFDLAKHQIDDIISNTDALNLLCENLNENIANFIIDDILQETLDFAKELHKTLVADRFTELVGGMQNRTQRQPRAELPQAIGEEDELVEVAPAHDQAITATESKRDTAPAHELGMRMIRSLHVDLPWVSDQGPTEVQDIYSVIYAGKEVLIIDAMDSKLKQRAEVARSKSGRTGGWFTQYDDIAVKVAKFHASGIDPHSDPGAFLQKVHGASVCINGDKRVVWHTNDRSPNAPRGYYTFAKWSEVSAGPLPNFIADTDPAVVLVIAEVDKDDQLEVLARLTGKRRRLLKAQGAGSI